MRSLVVNLIDELVAELVISQELGNANASTIERLKEIRNVAEGERPGVIDCTEQFAFSFVTSSDRKNGGGGGQTGGGFGAGEIR